jgi:hypothetical protein
MKRFLALAFVTLFTISQIACFGGGPLSKLDSTLDYAPFFFQALVISGKITQERADFYKNGIVRGEAIADKTKTCLSSDVKSDAQCYADLATNTRALINEFYPRSTEGKVAQFAALLQDVVNLIVQKNTPVVGAGAPAHPVTEKQIENKIDELDKLLHSEDK